MDNMKKMSLFKKILLILLSILVIQSAYTAWQISRIDSVMDVLFAPAGTKEP